MTSQLEHNIAYVSRWTEKNYPHYVDREDVAQELLAYSLAGGARVLARCADRGDNWRAMRYLFGVARSLAESEKAQKTGNIFGDVAWYSPWRIDTLLPSALNPDWGGENTHVVGGGSVIAKEGGDVVVMVADIRRALDQCGSVRLDDEPGRYDAHVDRMADFLGGDYPGAPGYDRGWRQSVTNAAAREITERAETLWESRGD